MTYKDNTPNYNVNRKVVNYKDFIDNVESEKEKMKGVKRSFQPNSDRQQFVRNSRTEYNPVTHKLTDYTEGEVDDILEESWRDTGEISSDDLLELFDGGITVNIYLSDVLELAHVILLMTNGEIFEKTSGSRSWEKYSSDDNFKEVTGASINDEYKGNESPELLKLLHSVDDGRKYSIEKVYFDPQFDNPVLYSILKNVD